MKIAYLSTFYPFRGGIAQFNALLLNQLKINNEVKAYNFKLQYPKILFPGKTQLVQINDNAVKVESEQLLNTVNPISYIQTAKTIKRFSPDLLLTKFWLPFFAPSLGYVASKVRSQTKVISILDNVIPHEPRLGDMGLIKYFLKQNHGFVVMSEKVKNDLLKIKPDAKYLFQCHPLYDHFGLKISKKEARKKLNLPESKKIILYFGFIRDYKGVDLAIKAMKQLSSDYHLVIAGEVYGNFDKYTTLINELDVNSKISLFTHYISDDETPYFFSSADVCLLPYKSATQSGIAAISYHFDLPLIATDVGGLSEMIEPYNSGMIVEKADESFIAKKIEEYFSIGPEYFAANIAEYKSRANWEALAKSIENFYREL